jgi:sugar/nucleoside kinase (ribokinase family)
MRSKASISSSAMGSRAPSWDAALERPLAGLVTALVTTLGADGAQVETAEGRIASPGFTPKIVDTTGAGDCFAAACLHARLAAKLDWRGAIRFANCTAAISTTGLGAQSALPTANQVAAYLLAEPKDPAGRFSPF